MRLICPSCGAQYEVDDSVIPPAGRDVQCSGCGQTWFQPSAQMIEAAQETAREEQDTPQDWDFVEEPGGTFPPTGPEADAVDWPEAVYPVTEAAESGESPEMMAAIAAMLHEAETPATAGIEAETVPEAVVEPHIETAVPAAPASDLGAAPASEIGAAPTSDIGAAPRAGAVPRRPLDENLLAILREEAEREAAVRRAEGASLETQDEMNLDGPALVAAPVATPVAEPVAGTPVAPKKVVPAAVQPRRPQLDFSDLSSEDYDDEDDQDRAADLTEGPAPAAKSGQAQRRQRLPDIEEINSSLRASADRGRDIAAMGSPQIRAEARSGFRTGFTLVMLVAAVAVAIYGFAPRIATAVPALAPLLESYVEIANTARIWLDEQLRMVIERVQETSPKA